MNWNPAYSYATIPAGMTTYPGYYRRTLTTVVPEAQGIAHVRGVHIWNIATGSKTVFEVDAYPNAPLTDFHLDHWNVQAATAGHIADAKDWKMSPMWS